MHLKIEMTDTFGGEANYSWVRRHTVEVPDFTSTRAVVRRVKQVLGIRGRHTTWDQGDRLTITPSNACVIVFVDFTA